MAILAISVAIGLIVRILDPSREFYAARLASGNQPTRVDVSAANTAYPSGPIGAGAPEREAADRNFRGAGAALRRRKQARISTTDSMGDAHRQHG